MRYLLKFLIFHLIVYLVIPFNPVRSNSQFPPTSHFMHSIHWEGQPLSVPTWQFPLTGEGDILIDNFEYWDSPYNHGWRQIEPAYPFYGLGIGYETGFRTLEDFQQGNHVLEVYQHPSIFLLNTPYAKHSIFYNLYTPPFRGSYSGINYIDINSHPILSFKFRAPLAIEPWDIFESDL